MAYVRFQVVRTPGGYLLLRDEAVAGRFSTRSQAEAAAIAAVRVVEAAGGEAEVIV